MIQMKFGRRSTSTFFSQGTKTTCVVVVVDKRIFADLLWLLVENRSQVANEGWG